MDNIIFKKIYHENNLIELKITASAEFITAYQTCYVDEVTLIETSDKIASYLNDWNTKCYIEFGKKKGNYTPAFSMEIFPASKHGYVKIEVDIEIDDNTTRSHRCSFYIESEIGLLEKFGKSMKDLVLPYENIEISLLL